MTENVTGLAATRRFTANADKYAQFRPDYPDTIVRPLAEAIIAGNASESLPVLDVGSGTGIFSRRLATLLPSNIAILGIEPSDAMRAQAESETGTGHPITYKSGTAEALPVGNAGACAVVAATAAHWFDRAAFYREAARAVAPTGVLAITEYIRDAERSPAARLVETFLAEQSEPKAYTRPDYEKELSQLPGFATPQSLEDYRLLSLTSEKFIGLALSSSHARAVIERCGRTGAERALLDLAEPLVQADGTIPYGYRFRLFITRRV